MTSLRESSFHFFLAIAAFVAIHFSHANAHAAEAPASKNTAQSAGPINVIVDTDLHFDDILSLAMLHTLADRGDLRPIGITVSNDARGLAQADGRAAAFIDAIDTFYGRANLPIGLMRDPVDDPMINAYAARVGMWSGNSYAYAYFQQLTAVAAAIAGRYPHDLERDAQAQDAVPLLRRLLAGEPDGSVVLIQLGYATNFARLLASKADAASPLSGRELVARKVRLLSLMGGSYQSYETGGKTIKPGSPSANMILDTAAARMLFAEWPTQIVASGSELGDRILFPGAAIDTDFRYVAHHPIAESYRYMVRNFFRALAKTSEPYNHKMTDETSVLYAARPDAGYFSVSESGTITVLPDGGTSFKPDPDGRHRYLIQDESQRVRALEAMVGLVTQPPVRREMR